MDTNESDIKRFLDLKLANGRSVYTVRSQRAVLLKLDKFLDGVPFRLTTEDDIVAFFRTLNGNYCESTIMLSKIVVKSFYRHLYGMRRHEYPPQVINIVVSGSKRKLPIRPEDVITKEDIVELLRWCTNFRDKAMIVTLYESGARLSEFININIGHLKFDSKGCVLVIDGKTGQRRIRLIESVLFLQRWVESHPHNQESNAPLWCAVRLPFNQLCDKAVESFLRQLKKKSCFPKPINPHSFRHSRITELAKYLSDAKLKVFAGWTGSSTMAGTYVHLAGEDIEDDLLEVAGVKQ
jgi:integrase